MTVPFFEFFVDGQPRPKGSARAVNSRSTGKAIVLDGSKYSKAWQRQIEMIARQHAPAEPLKGAVELHMSFHMPRPAKETRPLPTVRPDLDKLCRTTLDGLTKAGIYQDDGQVTRITAKKIYDDRIGVHIRVCALETVSL